MIRLVFAFGIALPLAKAVGFLPLPWPVVLAPLAVLVACVLALICVVIWGLTQTPLANSQLFDMGDVTRYRAD